MIDGDALRSLGAKAQRLQQVRRKAIRDTAVAGIDDQGSIQADGGIQGAAESTLDDGRRSCGAAR